MDIVFHLPDLAPGPSSVGRRIHNDAVIMVSAPDFSLHKFPAVIHQPADLRVLQPGGYRILLRPGDHSLRRVHMGNRSSGCRGSQGRSARIGKEVQHPDLPPAFRCRTGNLAGKPVPVGRLLREQSGMLERKRLELESQADPRHLIPVTDRPLLRQVEKFPFPAAPGRSVIVSVGMFPSPVPLRRIPDHLGIRPDQQITSPSLQLFPAGRIQKFIILPVVSQIHHSLILSCGVLRGTAACPASLISDPETLLPAFFGRTPDHYAKHTGYSPHFVIFTSLIRTPFWPK